MIARGILNFIEVGSDISELVDTWNNGEYLGPYTDMASAGKPMNKLDALAKTHDISYARAERRGGRASLVGKAQADFAMAGATNNYVVKSGMYIQGMIRVFTFNSLALPW